MLAHRSWIFRRIKNLCLKMTFRNQVFIVAYSLYDHFIRMNRQFWFDRIRLESVTVLIASSNQSLLLLRFKTSQSLCQVLTTSGFGRL